MSGKNKSGLGGLLRSVNNVSRTVNSVNRTKNSVNRMVGGNKNNARNKKEAKNAQAQPDPNTWTCACGTPNTTNFCGSCGKAMPVEVACPKCGWKRTPENSSLKFCGECGEKFEE